MKLDFRGKRVLVTDGLRMENRGGDIVICSAAPGGIATEMVELSGLDAKFKMDGPFLMSADATARDALRAFKRGKALRTPGLMNRVSMLMIKILPRSVLLWFSERMFRPSANS